MGPYKSQIEATNALRLAPQKDITLMNVLFPNEHPYNPTNSIFPDDAFVWPEEE